ncbi:hypothetical protein SAMN02745165_01492 [Malonomonas rubra DSM 5091]|uniref:Porin n=1 Tax=Malonomonas rubra DSM 5091 TaxID=1122189 RepID=A0A1M6GCC0_MALRU|nr:hypothetical protein [Malonomonas rubra]SHJ07556.1 hypothetical protein SAMN02745165_01492 [Malonomonas rubra DSM 5091]
MSRFLKIAVALLAIAALATPAIAEDYKFSVYGQARVNTYYTDVDEADTQNLTLDLMNTSRFGMKASKGAISGQYEIAQDGSLRLLYGAYKFDGGTFSFGQQYNAFTTASFTKINAVNDAGGAAWGLVGYAGRVTSLKVAFDNGFMFAAVENSTESDTDDVVLPKLEAAYKGKAGDFAYTAAFGFKDHQLNADDSIDCYLASFIGNMPVGNIALKFNINYGQNAKQYGMSGATYNGTADDDAELLSGFVQASMKANDSNLISAGIGYAEEDIDSGDKETRMVYFIQDQITIAPGFTVSPEIVYADYSDIAGVDGADDDRLYVGAKWQINF